MTDVERYVIDTSGIMALRGDEPGADRVEELLRKADSLEVEALVSFMTRMELLYRIATDEGPAAAEEALRLLDSTAVIWVSCEPAILAEAARIKAGGGLSVADAWIAATARVRGAILVHRDPEFERVGDVRHETLLPKHPR